MIHKKRRSVHPAIIVLILSVITALGILWVIRSTQEAVKVTDSISETAEDQTGNVREEVEVVLGNSDPDPSTSTVAFPVIISDEEASKDTVVVNKKYRLSSDYEPALVGVRGGQMRQSAADSLDKLFRAAEATGMNPLVVSSYRSYVMQEDVYNGYVNQNGQKDADTFSARPGHSEHQTGLAVDVDDGSGCQLETCFGETQFGKWLQEKAHFYGYIVRYPLGKDAITGYQYEPWHIRYVGSEAEAIVSSGKTMDEFYGVEAGNY